MKSMITGDEPAEAFGFDLGDDARDARRHAAGVVQWQKISTAPDQ